MSASLSRCYSLLAHQIQDKDLGELIVLDMENASHCKSNSSTIE